MVASPASYPNQISRRRQTYIFRAIGSLTHPILPILFREEPPMGPVKACGGAINSQISLRAASSLNDPYGFPFVSFSQIIVKVFAKKMNTALTTGQAPGPPKGKEKCRDPMTTREKKEKGENKNTSEETESKRSGSVIRGSLVERG